LDDSNQCACTHAKHFISFYDPETLNELSNSVPNELHIRMTDLRIILHRQLSQALAHGMNHIPLHPTDIGLVVDIIINAFEQLINILGINHNDLQLQEAC
jgi:hypothetical protein